MSQLKGVSDTEKGKRQAEKSETLTDLTWRVTIATSDHSIKAEAVWMLDTGMQISLGQIGMGVGVEMVTEAVIRSLQEAAGWLLSFE